MNLHFSFKAAKSSDLDAEIQQHVQKLERRLQVFRPDLIHLHGTIDQGPRELYNVKLNLRLPSGQITAQDSGSSASAAVKIAFGDLLNQLKRHKELLRNEHKWQRQKGAQPTTKAPSLETADHFPNAPHLAEGAPPRHSNGKARPEEITAASFAPENRSNVQTDVRTYIDANLPRLERFVTRELRYLEASGQLPAGQVSQNEVVDEVVVTALSAEEKPEQIALERWLYRLAMQVIRRASAGESDFETLPLEQSVGVQNVSGSDELFLQFHQPGESLHREDVIADKRAGNPEEQAASDEQIDQLETALRGVTQEQREAFVLFAIEGFTVAEISQVTDRKVEQVREEIAFSREHLIKKLPSSHSLKKKLIQHSSVA